MSTPNEPVPTGDQVPKLLGTIITFDILAFTAIILRFVSRRISHASLWWDDWFMIAALFMYIAGIVVDAGDIASGAGKHAEAVGLRQVSRFLIFNYMAEMTYVLALTFSKCSILCLYLRIFGINPRFRKVTYGLTAIAVAWGTIVTAVAIFQCSPIAAAYDPLILHKSCINVRDYFVVTGILNIVIDVAILILPMPSLWKLQLPTSRKLTLSIIFTLGIFTSAISITRTVTLYSLRESDITWDFVPVLLYSTLEADTAIICANLPVMAPLLHLVTGGRLGSSREKISSGRKHSIHVAHATEGFSILREDSTEQSARRAHEVYAGAGEHELQDMGNNGQIHVTHRMDVEG